MKQRILITVIPGARGQHLLDAAPEMLADGAIVDYVHSLIASNNVLFCSHHLDLWSMGDSFDRFLRPKSKLWYFDVGSSQLYAIRRDLLHLRAVPRDEKERLFRVLLQSAKSIDSETASDALLFVMRQVFGASGVAPIDTRRKTSTRTSLQT